MPSRKSFLGLGFYAFPKFESWLSLGNLKILIVWNQLVEVSFTQAEVLWGIQQVVCVLWEISLQRGAKWVETTRTYFHKKIYFCNFERVQIETIWQKWNFLCDLSDRSWKTFRGKTWTFKRHSYWTRKPHLLRKSKLFSRSLSDLEKQLHVSLH